MAKLRVFTSFSGYDSQCMALDRLGIYYELTGWSEIDRYAIQAHNAVYPQWSDRNYGDICNIDWKDVPDFDLFTYSSPCQDFSAAGLQRGGGKVAVHVLHFFGSVKERLKRNDLNIFLWRTWQLL